MWVAGINPAMTVERLVFLVVGEGHHSPSPLTGCLPFLLTHDSLRGEKALRRNNNLLACVSRASSINSPATLMGY
jgi:hypothetical protein